MLRNSRSTLTILKEGNIAAGGGYSTDSQQPAPQLCYNGTISSISGQSSSVELNTAQSFSSIQNSIHESITVKGGFSMFSASTSASYLRTIEDKYYSLSLNYHAIYHDTANIQLGGFGLDALTELGKSFYNNGNNPYFGLICGDEYFSSYQQGSMLLMGVNIEFRSHSQKEEFNAHIGTSFGNIFSASADVQRIANQYGISGSVSMQAYQIGGDPSQLSKILNKNGNGDYYVLTCSLQSMGNCISAASGMLDYAVNIFPAQVSFPENKGLTPLGTGFATSLPIYYVGLTPPPSFVTQQVIDDRLSLADNLDENQYYQQRFENLLNGYPVQWDTSSSLYKHMEKLHGTVQENLDLLLSSSNPKEGGLGCYITPDKCVDITETIEANLVPITADDLTFLDGFGGIQYVYAIWDLGAYVYRSGNQQWSGYPSAMNADNRIIVPPYTFSLNAQSFNYTADFIVGGNLNTGYFSGTSNDGGLSFNGIFHDQLPPLWNTTYNAQIDPFWFEPYNSSNSHAEVSGEVPVQDVVNI